MSYMIALLVLLYSCLGFASSQPSQPPPPPPPPPHPPRRYPHISALKPGYFLLAGDSTTASQSTDGGGWGDGFLNFTLRDGSTGRNYGLNGATTASFRAGGDWDCVIADAKRHTEDYTVYVTIQFGHIDRRNTSGVSPEQYGQNLQTFVQDVEAIGAIPVLVTPLTRRNFNTTLSPPSIIPSLGLQRDITIQAARSTHTRHIDLNAASSTYCDTLGATNCWKYDLEEGDHTHLNVRGSVVFGRMVSDLLALSFLDIAAVTQRNDTMSSRLRGGLPV